MTNDPAPFNSPVAPAPPNDPAPALLAPPTPPALLAPPTPPTDSPYRPGICNIGPEEIRRRRRAAISTSLFAAIVAVGIVLADLPQLARLAIFPFAAAAGVSWLQVFRKFCVAFGAAGVLNFGVLGSTERVADVEARATDRRIALRMVLEGSVYGLLVTLVFVVLPA